MIINHQLKRRHKTNGIDLLLSNLEESIFGFAIKNSKLIELDFLSYNSISEELLAENYIYEWVLPYKSFLFSPQVYVEEAPIGSSVVVDILQDGQTVLESPLEIRSGSYASSVSASFKKNFFSKFSRLTFNIVQVGVIYGGGEISFKCNSVQLS